MLKTSVIQRGSDNLKKISKAAKQAHSLFVGVDAMTNHVQHNKAFSQDTRDKAKNARYITSTLANLTSDAKKAQQKFTTVPRNIPTHPHIRVPSSSNPSDDEILKAIQGNWNRSQVK